MLLFPLLLRMRPSSFRSLARLLIRDLLWQLLSYPGPSVGRSVGRLVGLNHEQLAHRSHHRDIVVLEYYVKLEAL